MKISVVIPIYGVERFIERCVRSVAAQSYVDKELIFIDDATPDQSIEIVQHVMAAYPQVPMRILRHEKNRGLAAARRTGLDAVAGEYVISVDGDDYLEQNALELLAEQAQQTHADIIAMDCFFEWNDKRSVYRGTRSADPKQYSRILVSGRTLPGVCLHMIRMDLYRRTQIWPIEGLNNGEDFVLTPRLSWYANCIAWVNQPIYHYIQTNTSSYVHAVSQTNITNLIQAIEVLTAFYADKPDCEQALRAGQWLKKTELMMRVARKDYAMVDTMPAALPANTETMTVPQRIAAPFVAHRWWSVLWLYSRCFELLLELTQILKGRRKKC